MTEIHFNYQLASRAGYKFNIVDIENNVFDELAYWKKEQFPDVIITRPNVPTELDLLHNKALMTVNGFIYPTVFSNENLYIPNATKSMLKSRSNHIGIYSFNKLSNNLIKHKIEFTNISPENGFSLFEKAIITFDVEVNFPLLVICGYMILEDGESFYRVSPNSFVIRLDRLSYIDKLFELNNYRDIFTELNIPVSEHNSTMIDYSIARSDVVVNKFLSSFNSFIVDLPIDNLHLNKIYLEHSNIPSTFRTEKEPNLPIFIGRGKFAEYTKNKILDNKYSVTTLDSYYNNYLFSYLPYTDLNVINGHRFPGKTHMLSNAFFLDLHTNV